MSKYYKAEDVLRLLSDEYYSQGKAGNLTTWESIKSLPTIEVEGGDLEDAILLTKDAYSDLCLRASQVSDKAECDNCIWNVCNYNKIDFEVSEDCISREYLEEQYWQALTPKEMVSTDVELGINIGIEIMHNIIKEAPSVVPSRAEGEWINKHEWANGFYERECSICGAMKPQLMHTAKITFCPNCGADMRGKKE